jgi:hypothetical protein
VAPQEDHEPEKAQSRTLLESEALQRVQERAPSISSAPLEPPVQQRRSSTELRTLARRLPPISSLPSAPGQILDACGLFLVLYLFARLMSLLVK